MSSYVSISLILCSRCTKCDNELNNTTMMYSACQITAKMDFVQFGNFKGKKYF